MHKRLWIPILAIVLVGAITFPMSQAFGAPREKNCDNGEDSDGDGFTDCEDENCWTKSVCGARGKKQPDVPLIFEFFDPLPSTNSSSLLTDGDDPYVHKEGGIKAFAGAPNPDRLAIEFPSLKMKGGNVRRMDIALSCFDELGSETKIGDCSQLRAERRVAILSAIPYPAACPGGGTCNDVFAMTPGVSELMSAKVLIAGSTPWIEIASNIGGGTVIDPGLCLSKLSLADRNAYQSECREATELPDSPPCNATVTFVEDLGGTGIDGWTVEADGARALICDSEAVIGMSEVSFAFDAIVK